ncbi:MAG TPA: ABC transporter substrate-binding protein [Solirubrobacterales bacterium]|nr:ABC transporter substrate-binding protein [Solirubrobacterales bacterium]
MKPSVAAPAALLAAALLLVACGEDDGVEQTAASAGDALAAPTEATLVLDFIPNAVHTGIYCARAEGLYEDANVELEIVEPSSTADTLRLIEAGEAEFGIADGIDIATQIDRGRGARGVMALTQRPLGGLLTLQSSQVTDPSELEGRLVGVTGVPSDDAVLETMVAAAGGDPAAVETVAIGFNGPQALLAGRVDAFTGFLVPDGAAVEARGRPVRSFPLDDFGGPAYPGLVVFSTEERITAEPELMAAFVGATVAGYRATIEDPDRCLQALIGEAAGLDDELQRVQLDEYLPLFGDPTQVGAFDEGELAEFADFLVASGLTEDPVSPERYATGEFLPR